MDNTPNINDIISNLTPDDINMLKGVASSILGEGAPENTQSTTQNFNNNQNNNQNALQSLNSLGLDSLDFNMIMKAKSIFDKMNNTPNKNVDLIMALKPHLRPETQNKADQAMKIIKLFEVLPLLRERVNDMQKRAKSLTNDNDKEHKKTDDEKSEVLNEENKEEKDDSSLIILALIMLLSHEGADNMLILALLYLLF